MDSYDIFKKLTVGVKFKRREPKHTKNVDLSEKKTTISVNSIKKEENERDDDLTLISNLTVKQKNAKEVKQNKILKLQQEEINHYRNINNLHVVGRHVADPLKSFNELSVGRDLLENIKKCGYEEPTPIQKQAIPIMLQGRQMLACAPTGSGKTVAFLLPIIHDLGQASKKGCRALILAPTRELANQIQRECVKLSETRGLRAHLIRKVSNIDQFGKKIDILISTPNRLCYFLSQENSPVSLSEVEWLIIDEADKLFETGVRSFRDQLIQVMSACSNEKRKIAMFSATHTPAVAYWCRHNMRGLITVTVGQRNSAADTLQQELVFVGNEQGKLIAFRDLVRKGLSPPVLVFVQSKERAQQLFSELIYDGINVDAIHADRTQQQRDNTVRAFREGRIWVLICTELMARGVDFKGVNLVINYDFPPSAISYIHRIGRAGRAGRPGKAITLFTTEDTINLRSIAQVLKQSGVDVPEYMLKMKKRGKKYRKQLLISAPKREDITTDFISKKRKNKKLSKQDKPQVKNSTSTDSSAISSKSKKSRKRVYPEFKAKNKFKSKKQKRSSKKE